MAAATAKKKTARRKKEAAAASRGLEATELASSEPPGDVAELAEKIGADGGAVLGVFHAAGIPGGGVIQLKSPDAAAEVLEPKVFGTWVLGELFKDAPLDWFLLCSSTLGVTSQIGQVDYCAANAYLDAFAHSRSRGDGGVTVSINWDGWQEVGMAAEAATRAASLKKNGSWGRAVDHPLLDECMFEEGNRRVFRTELRAKDRWILDEHRLIPELHRIHGAVVNTHIRSEAAQKKPGYAKLVKIAVEAGSGSAVILEKCRVGIKPALHALS